MKKLKLTQTQFTRIISPLNETTEVKGGLNRVNDITKSQFKALDEDLSAIVTSSLPGVDNTKMQVAKEVPKPKHVNEDILSPELHQSIHNFIENIWMNPSQKGLDKFFVEHGITWGDIISYLTGMGILGVVAGGVYKVKNFFKRKFSPDKDQAMKEKKEEIDKITAKIEKDPKAPWSMNILKDPKGQQLATPEVDENYYTAEPHPDSPEANRQGPEPKLQQSNSPVIFKPIAMGGEIAILNGPDGKYSFYFGNMRRDDFPNADYQLDVDDIADYVNDNIKSLSRGDGLKDFEKADLVKLDEPLKAELLNLYSKDHKLVGALNSLEETTGAASSGAFVGPMLTPLKPEVEEQTTEEEPLEEITTAASSGQYVQPAFLAKDKKNWAGAAKTQYPKGEMVSFDSCTKLNNNKSAENGKCSQGAIDNVVKTHKTKNSVISRNIYTEIAKKTGRKVEDVQELIESKMGNTKSL